VCPLPDPNALILVAVVIEPRDLEIARLLGWYRIPLRTAPKVVAVDYLAFYQTGAFGAEKWRIQFICQVLGHELVTRAELLQDEPTHPRAAEEYYKIQIGPLESLPTPILAEKWHRITFLYTTGEYLLNAHRLNDLVVQSEDRNTLWRALRERARQTQAYHVKDYPDVDLDPKLLAMLLGIKELEESYQAGG